MRALIPTLPVMLPLVVAICIALGGERWTGHGWARLAAAGSFVGAVAVLAARSSVSSATPTYAWATINNIAVRVQLDWADARGVFAALLLLLGAVELFAHASQWCRRTTGGRLVMLAGSCFAVGATTALVASMGVGLVGLGLVAMMGNTSQASTAPLVGMVPTAGAGFMLAAAAVLDPSLTTSGWLWIGGCLLLVASRREDDGALFGWLDGFNSGLPVIGTWLLVQAIAGQPTAWSTRLLTGLTGLGIVIMIYGTLRTVTAERLGQIVRGQWLAQWGLIILAASQHFPTWPLLAHAVWTTALLGWACATLQHVAGTDDLANMPLLEQPLGRTALVYGLAAASIIGLPLVAGYELRVQLVAALPTWITPLIFAQAALLALALVPPLIACGRRAVAGNAAPPDEKEGLPVFVAALALIPAASWAASAARGGVSLIAVIMQLLVGFGGVWLMDRRLRHAPPEVVWTGGEMIAARGWALPFGALRRSLTAPFWLRGRAWLRTHQAGFVQQLWHIQGRLGLVEQRYYLGIVIAMVVGVLLATVLRGQP